MSGCLANAHVLFGHGFDDGEVGVVVAHGSLSLAGCVNDVATDVSTITTGAGVGWKCQLSPDAGHHGAHFFHALKIWSNQS